MPDEPRFWRQTGPVSEDAEQDCEGAERAADKQWEAWLRIVEEDGSLMAQLPDKIMVGSARASVRWKRSADEYVTEMSRRLKVAIENLASETVAFRRAAEAAAEKSDRAAARLERLTWALIVLTIAVVALTVVLVVRG